MPRAVSALSAPAVPVGGFFWLLVKIATRVTSHVCQVDSCFSMAHHFTIYVLIWRNLRKPQQFETMMKYHEQIQSQMFIKNHVVVQAPDITFFFNVLDTGGCSIIQNVQLNFTLDTPCASTLMSYTIIKRIWDLLSRQISRWNKHPLAGKPWVTSHLGWHPCGTQPELLSSWSCHSGSGLILQ